MPDPNETTIPASRVPVVDPRTGFISREWYAFFLAIFSRTGGGLGLDGDKGDIVVSSGNTVWSIDDGAVTLANLGGDITPAGKALLDDLTAAIQRQTLGINASTTPYNASTVSDWDGNVDPDWLREAADQLARRVKMLERAAYNDAGLSFVSQAKWGLD